MYAHFSARGGGLEGAPSFSNFLSTTIFQRNAKPFDNRKYNFSTTEKPKFAYLNYVIVRFSLCTEEFFWKSEWVAGGEGKGVIVV